MKIKSSELFIDYTDINGENRSVCLSEIINQIGFEYGIPDNVLKLSGVEYINSVYIKITK
jgi:hypothetical protein